MNSVHACNSVTFYLFHEKLISDISRKCILPNMIGAVTASIIFGKTHALLVSENEFFHELKRNRMTRFMEFM